MQKLTHHVCFSLLTTAYHSSPVPLTQVSPVPSHLPLITWLHTDIVIGACVPLRGRLSLCCAMTSEVRDQGLCQLLQHKGGWHSAAHFLSASSLGVLCICLCFCLLFLQVQSEDSVLLFVVAWTITEIIRYSFYTFSLLNHLPYLIKWAR